MSLTVIGAGLGGLIVGAGGTYIFLQQRMRQVSAEKATLAAQLRVVADQLQQLQIQVSELQQQVQLHSPARPRPTPLAANHQPVLPVLDPAFPTSRRSDQEHDAPPGSLPEIPSKSSPVGADTGARSLGSLNSPAPDSLSMGQEPKDHTHVSHLPGIDQNSLEAGAVVASRSDLEVMPALLTALQHRDPLSRCDAASGLAMMANELRPAQLRPVLQGLGVLSHDPDAQVRLAMVKALAEIRSPKVLPYLRRALRDADSEVVKAASQALDCYRGAKRQPRNPARQIQRRLLKG